MMHHPHIAQQIVAERQRDMLDRASRDRSGCSLRCPHARRCCGSRLGTRPALDGPFGAIVITFARWPILAKP